MYSPQNLFVTLPPESGRVQAVELEGARDRCHFVRSVPLHCVASLTCTCVTLIFFFKDKKFSFRFRHQSPSLFAGESASFYEPVGIKSIWLRAEQCRENPSGVPEAGVRAERRARAELASVRVVRRQGLESSAEKPCRCLPFPRPARLGCRLELGFS